MGLTKAGIQKKLKVLVVQIGGLRRGNFYRKNKIEQLKDSDNPVREYIKKISHGTQYTKWAGRAIGVLEKYRKHTQATVAEKERQCTTLRNKLSTLNEQHSFSEYDEWLTRYAGGVDFGYNGIKLVWVSPDKNFAIVRNLGYSCWGGVGITTYSETEHWLVKLKDGTGKSWVSGNTYFTVTGRLTKAKKQQLIDHIEEIC